MQQRPDRIVVYFNAGKQRVTCSDGKTEEREFKAGHVEFRKADTCQAVNIGSTETAIWSLAQSNHLVTKGKACDLLRSASIPRFGRCLVPPGDCNKSPIRAHSLQHRGADRRALHRVCQT